jgi:hypothetical protein
MKKLLSLLAAAFLLAVPFQSQSVVLQTRYMFIFNGDPFNTYISVDGQDGRTGPIQVHNGSVIYDTLSHCAGPGGEQVGWIQTQYFDGHMWVTGPSVSFSIPAGCESSHFVIDISGGIVAPHSESPYCPCQH